MRLLFNVENIRFDGVPAIRFLLTAVCLETGRTARIAFADITSFRHNDIRQAFRRGIRAILNACDT